MTSTARLPDVQQSDLIGAEVSESAVNVPVDLPEIVMPAGLPGFADVRRFALVRLGEDSEAFLLRGLDDEAAQFVVVPPQLFFPGYAPELDDRAAEEIGVASAGDVLLLAVVTVREGPQPPTANLLAPIVVNQRTRLAQQVVLDSSSYSVREPLPVA